jgi:hypothetical protein
VIGSVGAGCRQLEEPEAYSPTTSTTLVEGVDQEIAAQVQEQDDSAGGLGEFVPSAPPGYQPALLISADTSLLRVEASDATPVAEELASLATTRAVDDLGGGLVTQSESGGPIVYRQGQGVAEVLIDDPGAVLLDVGYWDGSPRAFIEIDGRIDWIQLAGSPGARQRQTHVELGADEELVSFSASRNLQAIIVQDSQCGELRFHDATGQRLDFQPATTPECVFRNRPVYGDVALSPGGDAVAYTIVAYLADGNENGTDLAARELIAGSEHYFRIPVGEAFEAIDALTFDGRRAGYIKRSVDQPDAVTLLELTVGGRNQTVALPEETVANSVAFARIPITQVS